MKPIIILLSAKTPSERKASLSVLSSGASLPHGNSACYSQPSLNWLPFSNKFRPCSLEKVRGSLWEVMVSRIKFVSTKTLLTSHNCPPMELPSKKDSVTLLNLSSANARSCPSAPSEKIHWVAFSVTRPSADSDSMSWQHLMLTCIFAHASKKKKLNKLYVRRTPSATISSTMPLYRDPHNAGPFRKMKSTRLSSF